MLSSRAHKSAHLLAQINWARPELAASKEEAADPASALLAHLQQPPRARFRFEYERKAEILAFLREHYDAWRNPDTREADRIACMTIEQAKGDRALAGIPALGQAWWATGDPGYGKAFERFYLETATGGMFNWNEFNGSQGSIELDAYYLLLDCEGFSPEGRIAFLDHLAAITVNAWDEHTSRWLQLSLGPEGHNWYLHGMHVLPFFGLLFPEFARADFFLRTGMSVVEEHVRGHFKADGGARETTIGYQHGSMRNLWDFYLIAHRNGYPLSPQYLEGVLRGTKFLLRLTSPQGALPSFGDDGSPTPGVVTELAAIAAALTGDEECKWYAEEGRRYRKHICAETPGQLPLSAFWAVGLEGAAMYAKTRARNPHRTSLLMGPTGYAALRNETDGYLAIAAADRGPIVTSHGHNDIFALDVHALGTRFIGEMGCAPYGDSPGRLYDEATRAHSTLTIDGVEQAPILDEWRWDARVIPAVRRWISEETHDFFHAIHEGFYRYQTHETLHARKVFFVKSAPSYWVVLDWVESKPENDYRIYFHGCVAGKLHGKVINLGEEGGPRLEIIPPVGDELSVQKVEEEGLSAYIRERKLDAERYPCFVYGKRAASDCFVWVLAPMAVGEVAPQVRRLPVTVNGQVEDAHGAVAVEIAHADCTDLLCLSHKDFDATLEFADMQTWGLLAFRRTRRDGEITLAIEHTMADGVCGR